MRASKLLIVFFVLTVVGDQLTFKVSAADSISYIGAVAEYYPVTHGPNGTTIANANANNYITFIKKARSYGADIIVFPESALATEVPYSNTNRSLYLSFSSIVPDPGTDIPCDNTSTVVTEAVRAISCAAKKYSIYIVINLNEMEDCTKTGTALRPCPDDGYFFYNTNVVFDRSGGIISRYRKYNLYNEPGFNVTSTPEIATFTTDFNVTFGQIICFDILFKTPGLTLINEYNVTDIVYPTHWFSELPLLTAVQTQAAWSYANDVNLLASSYNKPATGSGGSGIYIGNGGKLVTLWSESAKNALLIARIPKVINGRRTYMPQTKYPITYEFSNTEITTLDGIPTVPQQVLLRDTLESYTTRVLTLENGTTTTSLELCNRDFCCSFYVNRTFYEEGVSSRISYYRYRFAVFNGVKKFASIRTVGLQTCSVISCTDDNVTSCGSRFAATDNVAQPTVFNNILISGNFPNDSNIILMPSSVTMDILPLNASDFTFTGVESSGVPVVKTIYNLTSAIRNLLTFSIYGRNFARDELLATNTRFRLPETQERIPDGALGEACMV